jgi:hypothetical protein
VNEILWSAIGCMIMAILEMIGAIDNVRSLQFFDVEQFVVVGLSQFEYFDENRSVDLWHFGF